MVMAVEILLVVALIAGDYYGVVPVTSTPFFVALGWASLRLRGLRWRDVGFVRPPSWGRALVLGTLAGLAIELFATFVTTPALSWLTGVPPDLSGFRSVVGNARALLFFLVLNWTLFAIGEELAFRGYVMNLFAAALGTSRVALDRQPRGDERALRLGSRQSGHHRHRAGNTVGSAVGRGVSRLRAQPRDAHHRPRRVEHAGARADLLQSLPGRVTIPSQTQRMRQRLLSAAGFLGADAAPGAMPNAAPKTAPSETPRAIPTPALTPRALPTPRLCRAAPRAAPKQRPGLLALLGRRSRTSLLPSPLDPAVSCLLRSQLICGT